MHGDQACMHAHTPTTSNSLEAVATPALFVALQVYVPASSGVIPVIVNDCDRLNSSLVHNSVIYTRTVEVSNTPSFSHCSPGLGTPNALQVSTTVLSFSTALSLSVRLAGERESDSTSGASECKKMRLGMQM